MERKLTLSMSKKYVFILKTWSKNTPDDFKWQYWRKLLRIPWTARRSNQLNIKEINTEYSLEELMLMLKLCYFGHLMGRAD